MRLLSFFLFIMVTLPFQMQGQLGIGTNAPTRDLDVVDTVRVRGLGDESSTLGVSALSDGTLTTVARDVNAAGVRFIGFLEADASLAPTDGAGDDAHSVQLDLSAQFNPSNEYNESTNRFVPNSTGLYKVFLDFDITGYTQINSDVLIIAGLRDFAADGTSTWVTRGIFRHQNVNIGFQNPRQNSYTRAGYVTLTQGRSYGFVVISNFDRSSAVNTRTATLSRENGGFTGSSQATTAGIERIQ